MSRSANVLSVQALKDFKVAMINFAEDARNALGGVDMELRRMRDWLERDQLGYWQMQVKRRQEEVMQARSDLHRRKISQQGSDAVSDAEQKENLREAQRRLNVAEEKVALIKKLVPQLHHAINEYHSHAQPLGDHLTGGFERSVLGLERMVLALEAYLSTNVPTASSRSDSATEAGAATTTAAGSSTTTTAAEPANGETAGGNATATKPADGAAADATAPAGEPLASGRVS